LYLDKNVSFMEENPIGIDDTDVLHAISYFISCALYTIQNDKERGRRSTCIVIGYFRFTL
jgi:hypothetical protein